MQILCHTVWMDNHVEVVPQGSNANGTNSSFIFLMTRKASLKFPHWLMNKRITDTHRHIMWSV